MVFAMGEAMIFVVDSDEAVGQCDDEDMRKLEALAANKSDEQELASTLLQKTEDEKQPEIPTTEKQPENQNEREIHGDSNDEGTASQAHPNIP